MSPPDSVSDSQPPAYGEGRMSAGEYLDVARQHAEDIKELQGEVFGDRRNNHTGIKANVATFVAIPPRVDAVEKRVEKLEQNWLKKFWIWVISSNLIGTVTGGVLVWLVTQLIGR